MTKANALNSHQNHKPLSLRPLFFINFFIFSPSDSPLKTEKFILSKKVFSFSRYSNFCNFSSSFPHFPDSKGQMEVNNLKCHELACINLQV